MQAFEVGTATTRPHAVAHRLQVLEFTGAPLPPKHQLRHASECLPADALPR